MTVMIPPGLTRFLSPCLLGLLAACSGVEDLRMRELMVEKGFGTEAQGRATVENYVASGDGVIFLLDPLVVRQAGAERLFLLTRPQQVGIDGTINVPYVGPVRVLGKTARELTSLVKSLLQPKYSFDLGLDAAIIDRGKAFYAFGEFARKGRIPMRKGDLTALEAFAALGWTPMANPGRMRVIYPDAQHPLVVEVNMRELILTGDTTFNYPVYENTILYMPPTLLGGLARFIERILLPLRATVSALFGLAAIRASYDVLTGEADSSRLFFRF